MLPRQQKAARNQAVNASGYISGGFTGKMLEMYSVIRRGS
jgi:hypothetical protein